jgi:hypothetical protein
MPLSAVDVVGPAFERTKRQLLKPFRWGQWFRLALVGLLAGEIGQSGGCSARLPLDIAYSFPKSNKFQVPSPERSALFLVGILLAVLLVAILVVVLTYINSRMRFVLFDSIVEGECRIRDSWRQRGGPAFRYFVFQILFSLTALISMALLIGIPVLAAMAGGLFENAARHILVLVLGGVVLVGLFLVLLITLILVQVLTVDFVVPQMALEDASVSEGWDRLWTLVKAEKVGYAGYIGMKVLLRIAASFILGIAGFIVLLIVLIPFGGIGLFGMLAGRAAGLEWNPVTIAIAIVFGTLAVLAFVVLVALVSVPAVVFFPAYSMHFFAERYPRLHALLYPPAGGPSLSGAIPEP